MFNLDFGKIQYVLGIWRIRDSWEHIHSLVCGLGETNWFLGHAIFAPKKNDLSYNFAYLDVKTEAEAEKYVFDLINKAFVNHSEETVKMFQEDNGGLSPPLLVNQHYFEIRSADMTKVQKTIDLAISLPLE